MVKIVRTRGVGFRKSGRRPRKTYTRRVRKYRGPIFKTVQPSTMFIQHKYVDQGTLDVATIPVTYSFIANGMYDPNITGTGHQPMGFDQMKIFYNHYVVHKAHIKVTFWAESSGDNYGCICGIKLSDDATIPANLTTIIEQNKPFIKWKYLRDDAAKDPNVCVVKQKFNAAKYFGRVDIQDNGQDLGAAVGANPTEQAMFTLFAGHPTDSTDLQPVRWMAEIVYYMQYDEPTDLTAS